MKTETYPLCERCKRPITGLREGCIITGNLGVALLEQANGIVGDNFRGTFTLGIADVRKVDADTYRINGNTVRDRVGKSALHWWCLLKLAEADIRSIVSHADVA